MKRFTDGQKIRINSPLLELYDRTGTVQRILISDNGAWIDIDGELPETLRQFPKDDEYGRGNHIILYPEECEEEPCKSTSRTARRS